MSALAMNTNAASTAVVAGSQNATPSDKPLDAASKKKQFALRFKTELCRSFETDHQCPYEGKCVFAHGVRDLRTPEQNEADGLVTDAAIRAWLRRHKQQQQSEWSLVPTLNQNREDSSIASNRSDRSNSVAATPTPSTDEFSTSSETCALDAQALRETTPRPRSAVRLGYHHNPYSPTGITIVALRQSP